MSDAMRLAEILDRSVLQVHADAAAELRRLHAAHQHQYEMAGLMLRKAERNGRERDTLLAALRDLERVSGLASMYDDPTRVKARAAIAKVEGGSHE